MLETLQKAARQVPWAQTAVILGAGFLTASALSLVAAQLLFPDDPRAARVSRKPATAVALNSAPSLDKASVETIVERNIFDSEGSAKDGEEAEVDVEPEEEDIDDDAVRSKLPLRLVGTIYGGDPFSGIALIEDKNKKNSTNTVMVGETLLTDVTMAEVLRERVIVLNAGRREFIDVEKTRLVRKRRSKAGKSAPAPSEPRLAPIATKPPPDAFKEEGFERKGSEIVMSQSYRQNLLTSDFTKALQDAKATPNMEAGELRGFKLTRIRQDSIYEKAGLQNNDIVEEINGIPLTDTGQAIQLLNSLRSATSVEVRIIRGGSPIRVTLQVQ